MNIFFFDSFVVKKNYRGMGLGLKLMNAAKKKDTAKKIIFLYSRQNKEIFYFIKEKVGKYQKK